MPTHQNPSPIGKDARQRLRHAWEDHDALATVLLVMLLDTYGPEAFRWSPDTIRHELHSDLGAQVPDVVLGRAMAGIFLVTSDEFYQSLPTFNDLCVCLAGEPHAPGVFVPAGGAACAWGITEALLLSPPDPEDPEPFSDDIRAYLSHILHDEGILTPPDVLKLALHDHTLVDRVRYDFADDPELFNAIFDAEASKTDEINQFVRGRLRRLLTTLESLPLQRGQADQLARKLLETLPSSNSSSAG